jgi:DNA polymerase V
MGRRSAAVQWIGLPVCVGVGPTKTLAKWANHLAKKRPAFDGVCDLRRLTTAEAGELMAATALDNVWGVGPAFGVQTAHS